MSIFTFHELFSLYTVGIQLVLFWLICSVNYRKVIGIKGANLELQAPDHIRPFFLLFHQNLDQILAIKEESIFH